MKVKLFVTGMVLATFLLTACKSTSTIELFNGTDLDNWIIYVQDDTIEPSALFRAEDGVINDAGKPAGYIRTKESYRNFKLHVEWRWVDQPTNSGVLIYVQGEDRLWPTAIECQLQHDHAGDIILIGKGAGITIGDSTYLISPEAANPVKAISKMEASSEKEPGQWNSYDITAKDGELELVVNGVLQNRGTGLTFHEGSILLQSEGSPIQFRNIRLQTLD